MEQKTSVNGHLISYDDAVDGDGFRYLARLNPEESKVFFDEAYAHGSAMFEDHMGYKYKLIHNGSEYQIAKP